MATVEDDDFTFPATAADSLPRFFESPPLWRRPASPVSRLENSVNFEEYEGQFNLCSCQECRTNNINQNSYSHAGAAESQPCFVESPPLWRPPTSSDGRLENTVNFEEYEDKFNLCSCQECRANNVTQNSYSPAAESQPCFIQSPPHWRWPVSPATHPGNSASFKDEECGEKFNLCSCKVCIPNNVHSSFRAAATTTTESRPLWRQPYSPVHLPQNSGSAESPPHWRRPVSAATHPGNSARFKDEEYEEKFNLCSCQLCIANNINQNSSFRAAATIESPSLWRQPFSPVIANNVNQKSSFRATTTTESPPLWRQPFSPVSLPRNPGSFNNQEFDDNRIIESSSCDYNGEDEKMDVLWENLNEEISRTSVKMAKEPENNNSSPGREVQISCVKALKLSKVNGHTLSGKKARVLVFLRVLKKSFARHHSRRSIKKRAL